jgi:hypothetical protein
LRLPLRFRVPLIAVVLSFFSAAASDAMDRGAFTPREPSLRTIMSPWLDLSEILAEPPDHGPESCALQRAIGRGGTAEAVVGKAREGASPGKAVLLNVVAPGAGHIYSGYDRGYVYLGIEAAAWISLLVLHNDGDRRESQAENFAGDPFQKDARWNFDRYVEGGFCGAPGGAAADSILRDSWARDRQTYYDLIDGDASYQCGWAEGTWQKYRQMRDNSDELLRWARYASAVVILNHAISVLDVFRLTRSVNVQVPGGANLKFTFKPDLPYPTGRVQISRAF